MQSNEAQRHLTLQFLTWLAERPRSYRDVMEAWRSSCPRLAVWEDALADGLVRFEGGRSRHIALTERGRALIAATPARVHEPA